MYAPLTATAAAPQMGDDLVKKRLVQAWLGGITSMTLWRWENKKPELGFPKPIRINGHIFYSRAALLAWKDKQTERALAQIARPKTKNGKPLGRPRKEQAAVKKTGRTRKAA